MYALLAKIAQVVNAYQEHTGRCPRQINLPLGDAEDLAAADRDDAEIPDDTLDDRDEQESLLGPDALEGAVLCGATLHLDPNASTITCQ